MVSKKHKASTSQARPQEPKQEWDSTKFTLEVAWHKYQENVHLRNILPKRNLQLTYSDYDEFLKEFERRHWDRMFTRLPEKNTDVALVRELYSNIYDPEDDSPKQCKVRGKVIKFDAQTLNTFLEMLVVL